jgi:hypothetical protein
VALARLHPFNRGHLSSDNRNKILANLNAKRVQIIKDPFADVVNTGHATHIVSCNLQGSGFKIAEVDTTSDSVGINLTPVHLIRVDLSTLNNPDTHMQHLWTVEQNSDGFYVFRSRLSGRLLDAFGPRVHDNGCNIELFDDDGSLSEQWGVYPLHPRFTSPNEYFIYNRESGKLLEGDPEHIDENPCRLQLFDRPPPPRPANIWEIRRA